MSKKRHRNDRQKYTTKDNNRNNNQQAKTHPHNIVYNALAHNARQDQHTNNYRKPHRHTKLITQLTPRVRTPHNYHN